MPILYTQNSSVKQDQESTRSSQDARLSAKAQRLLHETKLSMPRRNAVFSIFTSMLNNGWTWTEAVNRVCDTGRKTAPVVGMELATSLAREIWVAAEEWVADNPPIRDSKDAAQLIGMIRASLIAGGPWRGRTSLRDRATLEAIHAHATASGRMILPIGDRDIAYLTGGSISRTSAQSALKNLMSMGWLRLEARGQDTDAHTYRLLDPQTKTMSAHGPRPEGTTCCPACGPDTDIETDERLHELMATDVFRELGKQAARVWLHLDSREAVTVTELVACSGAARSTVQKHLARLKAEALVDKTDTGYVRVEVDLVDLAVAMGVDGRVDAARAQIRAERLAWSQTSKELRQAARDRYRARREVAQLPTKQARQKLRRKFQVELGSIAKRAA